jgi:hypothetical protein
MARLIDLGAPAGWPSALTVRAGDVIVLGAGGANISVASDAVEVLGPFVPAVLGDNGEILSPMGAPGTVVVVARRPGMAVLELFVGDPWRGSHSKTIEITVGT